ncbi:MAG: Serine/threonine-protein kinase tel1 [Cirrosporium novae-zelandiae]|nr:MAG: Serine/threonine-protein kinase tel1 [Cirrosporium novae-zelandiae]
MREVAEDVRRDVRILVDRIRSEKVKERSAAIADLRHIFNKNRYNTKLNVLKEKDDYIPLFEVLFRVASNEKSAYGRANKSASKTQAASRLSSCASTIRAVVEVSAPRFRTKSVKALINHIIQCVPASDEDPCEPLSLDLVKSLRLLLEYQPHVEHLSSADWEALIDFCLDGMTVQHGQSLSLSLIEEDSPESLSTETSRRGVSLSRKSSNLGGQSKDYRASKEGEQFVFCIQQLVKAPNAPICQRSEVLLAGLLDYVSQSTSMEITCQAAFATLNSILSRIVIESIAQSKHVASMIIPLIKRLWHTRSSSLRDEMLMSLVFLRSPLRRAIYDDNGFVVKSNVESLLELLQADYGRRSEKDQLQVEDINMSSLSKSPPLGIQAFYLRPGSLKSEPNWVIVDIMAFLIDLLSEADNETGVQLADRSQILEDVPKKRQRVIVWIDELLRQTRMPQSTARISALQLLSFVAAKTIFSEEQADTVLDQLIPTILDANGVVASWGMLAMAGLCSQPHAASAQLKLKWIQVWRLASRSAASSLTARAACRLMYLLLTSKIVLFHEIADTFNTVISSMDLSGPRSFADSPLDLWALLVKLRSSDNPGKIQIISERVLRWLFSRFTPERFTDRLHAASISPYVDTARLLNLLLICSGRGQWNQYTIDFPFCGPLAQAYKMCNQHQSLQSFLYLLPIHGVVDKAFEDNTKGEGIKVESPPRSHPNDELILEYLASSIGKCNQAFLDLTAEKTTHVNGDMVRVIFSFSLLTESFSLISCIAESHKGKELQKLNASFQKSLFVVLGSPDADQSLLDVIFEITGNILGANQNSDHYLLKRSVRNFTPALLKVIKQRHQESINSLENDPIDGMDLDDPFESQRTLRSAGDQSLGYPRDDISLATDIKSFRQASLARLQAPTDCTQIVSDDAGQIFADYITSLEAPDVLRCREVVLEINVGQTWLTRDNASQILEHLAQEFLGTDEHDCCEVSVCLCIDFMSKLIEIWPDPASSDDDLVAIESQVYQWFINTLLRKMSSSPKMQISLASMIHKLIKFNPKFIDELSLPSPRTVLFGILAEGNITVKYHVSAAIVELFSLFVLKEHDAILGDVVNTLPLDGDWDEGIALRLFILGRLASKWHTLLRRSIYYIFEIPAQIPTATEYATCCLVDISNALNLEDSRELFKLFAPQVLYTHLEGQELDTIPFSIFGYNSLKELLNDVRSEVVGQIAMRANENQAEELSELLDCSVLELVTTSFDKALAYSVGRDVTLPPSQENNALGAEMWLRRKLGKEVFLDCVQARFAEIIRIFFCTIDQEDQIERAFNKRQEFSFATKAFEQIKSYGCAAIVLPPAQQPSFRAKNLLYELEHLCRRANVSLEQLWTPALVTFVFRGLMNSIHPAIGPLHACSVIRRIRILVCLVGDAIFQNYPIEMMIHALRPFVTDAYCASDTLGIMRYLFTKGKSYLLQVPSFVTGIGLSTLLLLRDFTHSIPDSTTQESHHHETLSKAQEFHAWLGNFLDAYDPPTLVGNSITAFRSLVRSARRAQVEGSSLKGTSEAELLREILDDDRSERRLLDKANRDLVLGLLCKNFRVAPNFRQDILGEDNISHIFSSSVWRSCQDQPLNASYHLWAARVLGRAFASTGELDHTMLRETFFDRFKENGEPKSGVSNSEAGILSLLQQMLSSDQPHEVGRAEISLQIMVARLFKAKRGDLCDRIPQSIMCALIWHPYLCPEALYNIPSHLSLKEIRDRIHTLSVRACIRALCLFLISSAHNDPIIGALGEIISSNPEFSEQVFPYILHHVLLLEFDSHQKLRGPVSELCQRVFQECDESKTGLAKLFINAILYLRVQPIPRESVKSDRERWLEIDYQEASKAAIKCKLFKTALLFVEIHQCQIAHSSRRSSIHKTAPPNDLLLPIFKSIDEPDSFYGVSEQSTLEAVMERLDYEKAGFERLSFQSAFLDSQLRQGTSSDLGALGVVKALNSLAMSGLAQSLLQNHQNTGGDDSRENLLDVATNLRQWDTYAPSLETDSNATFRVFQGLNHSNDRLTMQKTIDVCLLDTMKQLKYSSQNGASLHSILRTLAVLVEVDEVITSENQDDFRDAREKMQARCSWMNMGNFNDVNGILTGRETLLGSLVKKKPFLDLIKTSVSDAQEQEVRLLLESSQISRKHGALQNSLRTATYLSTLVQPCRLLGLEVEAAVRRETANVLWDQSEMTPSIRMLQELRADSKSGDCTIPVSRPELLATLGHHIAQARLEKPDEIIRQYLTPAIKELKSKISGDEAGQVFHQFASFCDLQLQNPENIEEFSRIKELRAHKEQEVLELDTMLSKTPSAGRDRDNLRSHRIRAKSWFDLDDREFQRLQHARQSFLRQSLENYLLCLEACDNYDSDMLRFCALWLAQSDDPIANGAVSNHVKRVPTRKFVPLMNQLSSRLLDNEDDFQQLLFELVARICIEHPYHGMYQVFASSKTKGGRDKMAISRNKAANNVVSKIRSHKYTTHTWIAVHNSNVSYVKFALDKPDSSRFRAGSKILLRNLPTGRKLEEDVANQKIPPPTMKIEVRADCDYSSVPRLVKFLPEFSIASGVSAPKIVTAIASDGSRYKQLFKGGNDDLRQDSIMEQVFEQVSNLLQTNHTTRQRNLQIRTYKVLPLTANSGIIEFVPNTIPLHEYLLPAHQDHYPKDWKPNRCRKEIADVQSKTPETRVRAFRQVLEHFHPVMRYFFMERFSHPDDWFSTRLAYTRTTAAISILGYVLGLGDRHGHNILLDEKSGEVVHIDLGVAFEQGRVLPVPEVVPFRLTRDLVDGMGITKTEGVFRRCCEFTLDALRRESYSIMTILDVLRYDPLYSWSVSPLRLKRMQKLQDEAAVNPPPPEGEEREASRDSSVAPSAAVAAIAPEKNKTTDVDEPSEADRALTVVAKKLAKTLSVQATVNELIQQATDERNLAVLFCGWAAYA